MCSSDLHDVRALLATERQTISRRTLAPTDHDALRAAVTHRTRTIYQQAINERPEWLVELLTELEDRGTLEQVRLGQVRQLVLDTVTARELASGDPTQVATRGHALAPVRAF